MDRNQIKVLIRQMTLEEKAGQVTQLPSRYFAIQGSQLTGTETKLGISEEKKWLCGSILGKLDAVSMRNIQKENLERLQHEIISKDWFMTLLDFNDYVEKKDQALADYADRKTWAKKMLVNIAKAGFFSSDRTIEQYNNDIWHLTPAK